MKFILGIIVIAVIALTISNGGVFGASSASSLPPAKSTAIHAPVVMTKAAGDASYNAALAQANVDATEAARIYAQAQNDDANKRIAVATEQALQATRVSNDDAVSRQYATLAAVSIQATAESISQTIETNRVAYAAQQAALQATRQATTNETIARAEQVGKQKDDSDFWSGFWKIVAVAVAALLTLAAWKLIGRIQPRIEEVEVEVPVAMPSVAQPVPVMAPQNPGDEAKRTKWLADHAVAIRYVEDSIRKLGGTSDRLLSALELESIGGNRESHTRALAHLRELSLIQTKQGGKPEDQGTYVQESGGDLLYLFNKLITTPPPS